MPKYYGLDNLSNKATKCKKGIAQREDGWLVPSASLSNINFIFHLKMIMNDVLLNVLYFHNNITKFSTSKRTRRRLLKSFLCFFGLLHGNENLMVSLYC